MLKTNALIRKLPYLVAEINQINDHLYQVVLKPLSDETIVHSVGQYVNVFFDNSNFCSYSIANLPLKDQNFIELHISSKKNSSYIQNLFASLNDKIQVILQGPFGNCRLPVDIRDSLFIAGGYGIVPFKAMLQEILFKRCQYNIWLYWCVNNVNDFYLRQEFEHWGIKFEEFKFIPVLSNKSRYQNWQERYGVIYDVIMQDHAALEGYDIYLNGPTKMICDTLIRLKTLKTNGARFFSDAFEQRELTYEQ